VIGKAETVRINIWGSRGTLPRGGIPSVYGGNTPCITCTAKDGSLLVLDAGTGIYHLGRYIEETYAENYRMLMLFSHVHWDHIQGFPLFFPAYHPETHIIVHGGPPGGGTWENALRGQMREPYFPVPFSALKARISFTEWPKTEPLRSGPFMMFRSPTNHPGGGYAYRIDCEGRSMVYATDTEHPDKGIDHGLLTLASGADLLLYDSTFFPEEYPNHTGWGHSTWLHGCELAKQANVGKLILYHHDPSHDDAALQNMEAKARKHFIHATAAREGVLTFD